MSYLQRGKTKHNIEKKRKINKLPTQKKSYLFSFIYLFQKHLFIFKNPPTKEGFISPPPFKQMFQSLVFLTTKPSDRENTQELCTKDMCADVRGKMSA